MADFDLLEDVTELLEPLCLSVNQDCTRVGVGHTKGFVVYRIDRRYSTDDVSNTTFSQTPGMGPSSSPSAASGNTSSDGPTDGKESSRITATIEYSFPEKGNASVSQRSHSDSRVIPSSDEDEAATGMVHLHVSQRESAVRDANLSSSNSTSRTRRQGESEQVQRMTGDTQALPIEEEEDDDYLLATVPSQSVDASSGVPAKETTPPSAELPRSILKSKDEDAPTFSWQGSNAPIKNNSNGIGAMALMYRTHIIAAVGGGPYPIGPSNQIFIFVGDPHPDRIVTVPDNVQHLLFDRQMLLVATLSQIRVHQFAGDNECTFAYELYERPAPLRDSLSRTAADAAMPAGLYSFEHSVRGGAQESASVLNSSIAYPTSSLPMTREGATQNMIAKSRQRQARLAIAWDYSSRCVVVSSSGSDRLDRSANYFPEEGKTSTDTNPNAPLPAHSSFTNPFGISSSTPSGEAHKGFTLLRYHNDLGKNRNVGCEVLAVVKEAHNHHIAQLALISNRSATKIQVASCSHHGTLLRVWKYEPHSAASASQARNPSPEPEGKIQNPPSPAPEASGEAPAAPTQNEPSSPTSTGSGRVSSPTQHSGSQLHEGTFVCIRELRNASVPSPVHSLKFIGDSFVCVLSQGKLKVFSVTQPEEKKAYFMSLKEKSAENQTARNQHSSLQQLGILSPYFKSEWSVCECPIPRDQVFVPQWVLVSPVAFIALNAAQTRDGSAGSKESGSRPLDETSQKNESQGTGPSSNTQSTATSSSWGTWWSRGSPNASATVKNTEDVRAEPTTDSKWGRGAPSQSTQSGRAGLSNTSSSSWMSSVATLGSLVANAVGPATSALAGSSRMQNLGFGASKRIDEWQTIQSSHVFGDRDTTFAAGFVDSPMQVLEDSLLLWWEEPLFVQRAKLGDRRHAKEMKERLGGLEMARNAEHMVSLGPQSVPHGSEIYQSSINPHHHHHHRTVDLMCVTCDGATVRFAFDPYGGVVTSSRVEPLRTTTPAENP